MVTFLGLDEQGFIEKRRLPDNRLLAVDPLTYERARLGISAMPPFEDAPIFADTWEYPTIIGALVSLAAWNPEEEPEPSGWSRHHDTGRYRIDGDEDLEYVKWDGPLEEQVAHAIQVTQGKDRVIRDITLKAHVLGPEFPHGASCRIVRSIDPACPHTPHCEWYDQVYSYLDRCVVLSMVGMFSTSMAAVLRRLME